MAQPVPALQPEGVPVRLLPGRVRPQGQLLLRGRHEERGGALGGNTGGQLLLQEAEEDHKRSPIADVEVLPFSLC